MEMGSAQVHADAFGRPNERDIEKREKQRTGAMDPAVPLLSPVPACELRPACLFTLVHSCGLRGGRLQEEERRLRSAAPGFSRYTRNFLADLADLGPKPADFHGVSSGNYREETRGCCRETRKRRGERGNMYTLQPKVGAATVATWEGAARWSLRFSKISLRERWNRNLPASTEICCRLLLLSRSVLTCPDGSAQNHSSGPPRRLHSARLFARKCLPSVHSTDHSVAGVEGHR